MTDLMLPLFYKDAVHLEFMLNKMIFLHCDVFDMSDRKLVNLVNGTDGIEVVNIHQLNKHKL